MVCLSCYECMVFAPIVISEGRDLHKRATYIHTSKNKHWVSLNDMNTGLLKKNLRCPRF